MGPALTAENMKVTKKEAEDIINRFYVSFPKVKDWIDGNERLAGELGYVEDVWGRRRRLPDAMLPQFEFERTKYNNEFNPILDTDGTVYTDDTKIINDLKKKLDRCQYNKDKVAVKSEAEKYGIHIHDNGGFISRAQRQATNSRIQGSAATMTKKAMIDIFNDKEINDLGFRLLIGVHDELIGECPEENAEKCGERLSYLMTHAALDQIKDVPFKCDAEIERHWYENTYSHNVQKEYNTYKKDGMSDDVAFNKLCQEHTECTAEQLTECLNNEN